MISLVNYTCVDVDLLCNSVKVRAGAKIYIYIYIYSE